MITIGTRYYAKKQGKEYVADDNATYRVIEFTAESIIPGLQHRAIINPVPESPHEDSIQMKYTWQVKMGKEWGPFNGNDGVIESTATNNTFVLLATGAKATVEEAKNADGTFKEGYNTSYFHVMRFIPVSASAGLTVAMTPMAEAFFEANFNTNILPLYAV